MDDEISLILRLFTRSTPILANKYVFLIKPYCQSQIGQKIPNGSGIGKPF